MRLSDWVAEHPGQLSEICRKTGLCYTTVWCCAHDRSTPNYATAALISEATGGAVSIAELCTAASKRRKRKRAA